MSGRRPRGAHKRGRKGGATQVRGGVRTDHDLDLRGRAGSGLQYKNGIYGERGRRARSPWPARRPVAPLSSTTQSGPKSNALHRSPRRAHTHTLAMATN